MKNILKIGSIITIAILLFILILALGSYFSPKGGRIILNKEIHAPFLDEVTQKDELLLFFGYVGCTDVCSPFLNQMHNLLDHKELEEKRKKIDLVFINLLFDMPMEEAKAFAHIFDKNFIGINVDKAVLSKLQQDFKLYFSTSLFDKSVINHTDYLYALKRGSKKGSWIIKAFYFTKPLNEKALTEQLLGQ